MSQWDEQLVRAEHAHRVAEALEQAEVRRVVRAERLSRKAERAAQRARLALARAL